ncbi:dihydrofolate reductase family protein [Streptomyces sp. MJP52]|uniref:dihydrofolate reductase family protein n=1 Tax=Streptomyces sp. MJP52 TaxID=2940555 RepID=UPI002476721C|nr:dihydrofolate reductase family protein [Streptomyces sp. MJP52]MDH6225281.1 dihydrofolate reductase [Streptomyces sp. MJP52]
MRNVILNMSVSLDGYMEALDGDISWHLVDEEVHRQVNGFLAPAGAFLCGRRNYVMMDGFWPTADQDPDSPEPVREFAAIWRDTPKVVYSRTLERVGRNATLVRDVVPEEVRALKERPGGPLFVGGASLAASFLRHGLIDEFHLYVHPVILGRGHRLFPELEARTDLTLADTRVFSNGVVLLHHRRA